MGTINAKIFNDTEHNLKVKIEHNSGKNSLIRIDSGRSSSIGIGRGNVTICVFDPTDPNSEFPYEQRSITVWYTDQNFVIEANADGKPRIVDKSATEPHVIDQFLMSVRNNILPWYMNQPYGNRNR